MTKTRGGLSIAELLVTMTACSVILTMSASLIHQAMLTQSGFRAFHDAERAALRLTRHFRQDVNAATAATLAKEHGAAMLLSLQLRDGETVEYSHSAGRVQRLVRREEGATAREEFDFRLPIGVDIRRTEAPSRIVLTIITKRDDAAGAKERTSDLHVEATLGSFTKS